MGQPVARFAVGVDDPRIVDETEGRRRGVCDRRPGKPRFLCALDWRVAPDTDHRQCQRHSNQSTHEFFLRVSVAIVRGRHVTKSGLYGV